MFRQKVIFFMHTVQKSFPLLHKVVLHYKIISSCNIWHTSAVSGVLKHREPLKTLFYYSVCKVHIFATLFRYSTLLTTGTEKWKYGNSGKTGEKFFVLYINAMPFHCSCKKMLPFLWLQPNACIVAEIHSAFSFPWIHNDVNIIVSFCHTMAMKCRLEDEIERQLKCKYVTDCTFSGASRSTITALSICANMVCHSTLRYMWT
jgi:hypothetical protein